MVKCCMRLSLCPRARYETSTSTTDSSDFNYYNDEENLADLGKDETAFVSVDVVHAHMDPFFNECRAFGQLIEADLNGEIAVRC